mmetsp:Transcript_20124/g.17205  ORF Transcript_20124/g.17205 Transcript_20124/m.17205 type:complete len:90 (-) Transcript_20124:82-351(-)
MRMRATGDFIQVEQPQEEDPEEFTESKLSPEDYIKCYGFSMAKDWESVKKRCPHSPSNSTDATVSGEESPMEANESGGGAGVPVFYPFT